MNLTGQINRESLHEKTLAIDTSTASMAIALLAGDKPVAESRSMSERNHSIRLVPAIEELFAEAGWRPGELTCVAVGRGPGSYTGVRIGVTVAKTLAWTLGCALTPVSSLEALAYGAWRGLVEGAGLSGSGEDGAVRHWFVPLMDARRGQAFTGLYEASSAGGWAAPEEDGIRVAAEWADELVRRCGERWEAGERLHLWFVGDTSGFADALAPYASAVDGRAVLVRSWAIAGGDVGLLARMKPVVADPAEIHAFVPNYTQLAEAEKKLLAKAKR